MDTKLVFSLTGNVVKLEAALLLLPLLVSLYYHDSCTISFAIACAVALVLGSVLSLFGSQRKRGVFAAEGFAIVSLSWILLSLIGALPFTLSGEIPSYVDAVFETVSGFTTCGASILDDVEAMSRSLLFWRSFTHWIGGMGILVLITAIAPKQPSRSMNILKAEMPGPSVDKITPHSRDMAKTLYIIYFVITILEVVFLLIGGMPLFDSVVHALGTAGTGGFGIRADSIGSYSPYLQWVITVFMFLFGVNFNLYYLLLLRRFRDALSSRELRTYCAIVLISALIITWNIRPLYASAEEAVRLSAFQVVSILTTTGFSTANFDLWPTLSKGILFVLMFIGGCAGSTAGGLKVSRLMMQAKSIRAEFRRLLHPRSVSIVTLEGRRIDESALRSLNAYLSLYFFLCCAAFLLLCFEPFDIETNFSAVVACINNIGPGFGKVGPSVSYSLYSPFSKIVLSFTMLLGRLEIYPLLLTLSPSFWRRG